MLKAIYKLKAIPTKIITAYLAEIEKLIPQTHMEVHKALNGQNNLKKRTKFVDSHFLILKLITKLQ